MPVLLARGAAIVASGGGDEMGVAHRPGLLERLGREQARKLLARNSRKVLARGEVVFHQGDPVQAVLLLTRGRIKSYFLFPDGYSITHSYWVEGMIMGLPGYTRWGKIWGWSAQAVVPSEVLCIDPQHFSELMANTSDASQWLIEILEFKLELLRRMVRQLATPSGMRRLRLVLLNLCDLYGIEQGTGILIDERFTHEELSELANVSRPWITQAIGTLRRSGEISIIDRKILVRRRDALANELEILDQTSVATQFQNIR
jgi:CRP-like cAMP-binding protein